MLKRLLLVPFIILTLVITGTPAVQGQGTTQGQGLEISPPLANVQADPGQTVKVVVRVRNVTEQTLVVSAETNDFTAAGEDGQPKLLLEEGEESPYSLKDWITTIDKVTLESQQQKPVTITLAVPQDASPGGHYGVARFTGTPPGLDGTGVSLSASIGTLMLVRVSGDVKEEAKIAELYAQNLKGQKRSIFEYGPLDLVTRIENTGNVHFAPRGTVRVTNIFGRETASFGLNESEGNVLPSSIRKFTNRLDKKLMFGRYTINADVVYGSQNTIVAASSSFWVIPYKLIAIALAIIILVIFGIKRYNRYIVKKSKK